jgi:hypothetical protein
LINEEEHFVVIKLVSGEQVMAILEEETEDEIDIVFPMLIRLFPVVDGAKSHEHVTATPYSQFADDAHLTIRKDSIIFIKNLNHVMIPHYLKLMEQENDKVLVQKDPVTKQVTREEELTSEEVEKRMKLLKYLTDEETPLSVVDGNDTIH